MKTNLFLILAFCFLSTGLFAQASVSDVTNDFSVVEHSIQSEEQAITTNKNVEKKPATKQLTKEKGPVNPKAKSTPGHSHLARSRYLRSNEIKGKE